MHKSCRTTFLKTMITTSHLGYELSRKTQSKTADSSYLYNTLKNIVYILRKLYMNSCRASCLKTMITTRCLVYELIWKLEVKN